MRRAIGWILTFAWAALAAAAQVGLLALAPEPAADGAGLVARALVPDLAAIVLVAVVARAGRQDLIACAVVISLARIGFTAASPFAVLAGTLAAALIADAVRGVAELERPALRVVAAAGGAFAFGAWLAFVDLVRLEEAARAAAGGPLAFGSVGPTTFAAPLLTGLVTGVIAFALWPLFRGLAGLSNLERRAF